MNNLIIIYGDFAYFHNIEFYFVLIENSFFRLYKSLDIKVHLFYFLALSDFFWW